MTVDLAAKGPASRRGWGQGWPTDRRRDMAKLNAGGAVLWVHHAIAPLVAWLVAETERRGYDVRPGQTWGYANRAVRGTQTPSNHSWGLAVDINAPSNPMTLGLVTDMPGWMPDLWGTHGFRWGGDYAGRKDAMHYEYMGTPADAAAEIEAIGRAVIPSRQEPVLVVPGGIVKQIAVDHPPVFALLDPQARGYWQVTEDGGVFGIDVPFFGSLGNRPLAKPIVAGDVSVTGAGYWLAASDGGVFAFGDAAFLGSLVGRVLAAPIVDFRASPTGGGYALMGADGGMFCFGDVAYRGSIAYRP